jgi:hypothetical protein
MDRYLYYIKRAFLIFMHRVFWEMVSQYVETDSRLWKKRLMHVLGPKHSFYRWIWGLLDGDNENNMLFDDFGDVDFDIRTRAAVRLFAAYKQSPKDMSQRLNNVCMYDLAILANFYLKLNLLLGLVHKCDQIWRMIVQLFRNAILELRARRRRRRLKLVVFRLGFAVKDARLEHALSDVNSSWRGGDQRRPALMVF